MRQIRTALSVAAGILFLLGLAAAQDQTSTPLASTSTLPFDMAERQRQAIASMPSAQATYHQKGTVRSIRGETGITISSAARALRKGESGKDVLTALRDVILVSGEEEIKVLDNVPSGPARRALTFSESIAGIPVVGGAVGIIVESSSGLVQVLNAQFLPDRNLPRAPKLTREEAREAARKALYSVLAAAPESVVFSDEPPTLAYVGSNDEVAKEALVWVVTAGYVDDDSENGYRKVWIHAVTGEYLGSESLIRHLNRTAYTAGDTAPNLASLPTGLTLLFTEGNAGGTDTNAISAYGNVGLVDQAWIARVGPSVLPPVRLAAHYAFNLTWNASSVFVGGKDYILFGDGDATSISPALVRDAVAHEYGHIVFRARYPALLGGTTESAALQEAYGDFLSGLVDVHEHGGAASASTWQICPVFTDQTKFVRSWSKPQDLNAFEKGFDWYPRALRGSQWFDQNSTIVGHWFYLLAQGGRNASYGVAPDIPNILVQGRGWDVAQLVLHSALTSGGLVGNPTFLDLRAATEDAANLLSPMTLDSTKAAWNAVGVQYNCTAAPGKPTLVLHDRCAGRWRLTWASMSGATTYFGQAVPEGWPWSLSAPIIDGNLNQCNQTVHQNYWVRLAACNGCGCSEFTVPQTMTYFPGACP